MNFIWDIVLQAARDDFESQKLFFKPAQSFSPYYEHAFSCINQKNVDSAEIEINPLMRFSAIFGYLLHPDVKDLVFENQRQFIRCDFDLTTHILAEIDLIHGMTKREFYIRKIRQEMLAGIYGETVKAGMPQLKRESQISVADEFLKVIETGSGVHSFCHIMKQIFEGCIIYQSRAHPQIQKQWLMLRETFLPFDIEIKEFWAEHFGIIGVAETMKLDAIAIF